MAILSANHIRLFRVTSLTNSTSQVKVELLEPSAEAMCAKRSAYGGTLSSQDFGEGQPINGFHHPIG